MRLFHQQRQRNRPFTGLTLIRRQPLGHNYEVSTFFKNKNETKNPAVKSRSSTAVIKPARLKTAFKRGQKISPNRPTHRDLAQYGAAADFQQDVVVQADDARPRVHHRLHVERLLVLFRLVLVQQINVHGSRRRHRHAGGHRLDVDLAVRRRRHDAGVQPLADLQLERGDRPLRERAHTAGYSLR